MQANKSWVANAGRRVKIGFLVLSGLMFTYSAAIGQIGYNSSEKHKFEVDAVIDGLGRNYVGCGTVVYSICVKGTVESASIFGDKSVLFIITCPEVLNGLFLGNHYKVTVEFYSDDSLGGLVSGCEGQSQEGELTVKPTKLKVLDIQVLSK
ncbi:MAG: hypothetical protein GC178_09985 [Flavobacteriales bacterium]|nr:hypothetical protein [Flavobacteriales bacterium]